MADPNDPNVQPPEQQPTPPLTTPEPPVRKDETVPGGRYLVNGTFVNAEGERHKNQKSE